MPERFAIFRRLATQPAAQVRHPLRGIRPEFAGLWPLLDATVPLFLRIRDRSGRLIPLAQNPVQCAYAQRRTDRNIILKARQMGMTTYIAARFFLRTIARPGTVTLQVAHSLESAEQIFRIVRRFYDSLDPDVACCVKLSRANVRELSFAEIDSRYLVDTAGNKHVGRGLTIHCLHASEVAQWPGDPEQTLAGLLAAVAPGGWVDVESTPRGAGGFFHRLWLENATSSHYTRHFFPWWMEPAYRLALAPGETLDPLQPDETQLIERHRLLPEQIKYRRFLRATFGPLAPQEYAETDADCFLAAGRPVFDLERIDARLRQLVEPVEIRANGAELIWLIPQPNRRYIIGADPAEGTEHGDYSAAVVIDAETGLQCAELLARWPLRRFAEALVHLGQRYNHALLAVERNNHGHALLYALQHQFHYPHLYAHRESAAGSATAKPGWPMNWQTKPQVVGTLAQALETVPEIFSSPRLLEQCRSFVYRDDGEAGALPGTHDDLVMAMGIALAVRLRSTRTSFAALPSQARFRS
jgi:hypothetical protein